MIPQAVQEMAANAAAAGAVSASVSVKLIELNLYLETITLALGALAGLFALGFQIRRYYRQKKQKNSE